MVNGIAEKECKNSLEYSCFELIPPESWGPCLEGKVGCAVAVPDNSLNKEQYSKERRLLNFFKMIAETKRMDVVGVLEATISRYHNAIGEPSDGETKKYFEGQYNLCKRIKVLYLAGIIS